MNLGKYFSRVCKSTPGPGESGRDGPAGKCAASLRKLINFDCWFPSGGPRAKRSQADHSAVKTHHFVFEHWASSNMMIIANRRNTSSQVVEIVVNNGQLREIGYDAMVNRLFISGVFFLEWKTDIDIRINRWPRQFHFRNRRTETVFTLYVWFVSFDKDRTFIRAARWSSGTWNCMNSVYLMTVHLFVTVVTIGSSNIAWGNSEQV